MNEENAVLAMIHEHARVEELRWEDGDALVIAHVDGPAFGRVVNLPGVTLLETSRTRRVG